MMRDETSHRFLDRRGWWRNRRAVRVEADGLVIERRRGADMHVPWIDIVGLQWAGPDLLSLFTPAHIFAFDRRVEDLDTLAWLIATGRADADAPPRRDDVARWLDGEHDAVACILGETAATGMRATWLILLALAAIGVVEGWLAPWLGWERYLGGAGGLLSLAAIALLTFAFAALGDELYRHVPTPWLSAISTLQRRGRRHWLTVDLSGVTLRSASRYQRLTWAEIERLEPVADGLLLTPRHDADALLIPPAPSFREATEAIWRVVWGTSGFHLDHVPPPRGALSLVRMSGEESSERRGLSLVEPE
jgi:hypothetical protein